MQPSVPLDTTMSHVIHYSEQQVCVYFCQSDVIAFKINLYLKLRCCLL